MMFFCPLLDEEDMQLHKRNLAYQAHCEAYWLATIQVRDYVDRLIQADYYELDDCSRARFAKRYRAQS